MYRKESLISRYGFMIMDIFSLVLAYFLASIIRFKEVKFLFGEELSVYVLTISIMTCIAANYGLRLYYNIFDRGAYKEFVVAVKSTISISAVLFTCLFLLKLGEIYSRLHTVYFMIWYLLIFYIGHQVGKYYIKRHYKKKNSQKQIMLVTTSDRVEGVLKRFNDGSKHNWYFTIFGIAILDEDRKGEEVAGIPVIAGREDMLEEVKSRTVDAVFISTPYGEISVENIQKILHDFQSMGMEIHFDIPALELDITDKTVENLGVFKVVTYSSRLWEPGQVFLKRCMDIVGGLIGTIITLVIGIFVGIAIKLDSPGPLIFAQERVGKNGRRFKMYKFRSMYIDAEERKKELLEKNEMSGAIFKMEADPRITRVGRFIRKHSIDEMPQFFNVLKGDMSLVGTRPPLMSEVENYRADQKRRLSVTPGMTGMWQCSGRSNILDFDEIVKMDLEYIDKWSIWLDIELLLKTIVVCIKGEGAK